MTLSRPDARLGLASGTPLSMAEAGLARLRVDLSLGEPHDQVVLWLWPGSKLADAQPGDRLTVSLGAGTGADPEQVLAGDVAGVAVSPSGTVLTVPAPSLKLSSTYVGRSWRMTTLGQVVRDLLDAGGVDAGAVDASLSLPALHVDPRRSVWSVLHDLARRTGHQVTSTADGALSFSPAPGGGAGGGLGGLAAGVSGALAGVLGIGGNGLREGAELIGVAVGRHQAGAATGPDGPRVSPASSKSFALLEAEPDDGSTVTVIDPALRTREAADVATSAAASRAARAAAQVRIQIPGRPDLRPGTEVPVTASGSTTSYRIQAVRHLLDAGGFVSDVRLGAAG